MQIVFPIFGGVVLAAAVAGVVEIIRGLRSKRNGTLWFGILLAAPLFLTVIINLVVVTFFAGFR